MWGGFARLGRTAFVLLTQRTSLRANGGGRGASQLAWTRRKSFLLRPELAVGDGPLCSSGYLNPERVIICHFCSSEDLNIAYKEFKDLLESKAILLIDVREKREIQEYGKIPGSISIPLREVVEALQMDPEHFKERYNQDMPSKSDHLVFSCLGGVRSSQALAAAKSLGFHRAQHYGGGFEEWAKYESSGGK
ncbi:thiosulfate sulfurtransferase/rhodanese-like domain-containing protein 3 [Elgaria multicarinata webbii]|uniref:thiosulfate sulfurtransferase/rhodanese-like domain-containing protein 3 n=1 Tax=Elgaria multicarinata webbii TaxID=159646 RepID=UPI002FCD20DF